jgi:predicted GNAT superfamily acetyltransferase
MIVASDSIATYSELRTNDDFIAVVELQRAVWGSNGFDPVPNHIMHVVSTNGGLVVGAQVEEQMVGFALAWPVRRGDGWILWSHIAGVHPDYQNAGIGFNLKQFQRQWALANDYDTMGWTFDPMQAGNANFNICRLGAISNTYKINVYGEMTDEVNRGLQSDRLAVTWRLHHPRVEQLAQGKKSEPIAVAYPQASFLLRQHDDGTLVMRDLAQIETAVCFVEVPYDLNTLKREQLALTREWQLQVRQIFQDVFAAGYWVVDFVRANQGCWYVLQKLT